jgi:hypothetical protein
MTKSDFIDWKRHPVTQQVFSQIAERVEQIKEELMGQAAHVPQLELAEKAGAAKAFKHILDIDYEES